MISQELKAFCALRICSRAFGGFSADEVKETFEVRKRSPSYFDRRHVRALGRRVLTPVARADK